MKTCPYCRINVGGEIKSCPICQNPLKGEGGENLYPVNKNLETMSLLAKILIFAFWAVFFLGAFFNHVLWDGAIVKILLMYLVVGITTMVLTAALIRARHSVPKIIFRSMLGVMFVCLSAGDIFHIKSLMVDWILPFVFIAVIVATFVFCFIEASITEDSILGIGLCLLLGIVSNIVQLIRHVEMPIMWSVCFLICIIALIAILIFKGRIFILEIRKRLNI